MNRFKPRPLTDRNDVVFTSLVSTANEGVSRKERVLLVSFTRPSATGVVNAQLGCDSYGEIAERVLENLTRGKYSFSVEDDGTLVDVRLDP